MSSAAQIEIRDGRGEGHARFGREADDAQIAIELHILAEGEMRGGRQVAPNEHPLIVVVDDHPAVGHLQPFCEDLSILVLGRRLRVAHGMNRIDVNGRDMRKKRRLEMRFSLGGNKHVGIDQEMQLREDCTRDSPAQLHFLVYSNMFVPPKRETHLEPALFAHVAPIDIDPIYAMGDPQSPPKNEYREILAKWLEMAHGRVIVYDYDQGMLVWRDLPAPSHLAFSKDVKLYRDLGVVGFTTETRMALATTVTNLYLRGRLIWIPTKTSTLCSTTSTEDFSDPRKRRCAPIGTRFSTLGAARS